MPGLRQKPPSGAVCGEIGCDGEFTQRTEQGILVWGCPVDQAHSGYTMNTAAIALQEEANKLSPYPGVRDHMARRSPIFAGAKEAVILERLMVQRNLSPYQAAAFLIHAKSLDLDPFLAQIAAITFKNEGEGAQPGDKSLVVMITEKGWAALAHRTEPEEFVGNPKLEPMTPEEKVNYGWRPDDVAYRAIGRKRSWVEPTEIIARVSKAEIDKGRGRTPLSEDPHHHCRIRAMRRWYEQNYPDAAAMASTVDVEPPDDEIQAIVEGTAREIPSGNGTEPVDEDKHPWLVTCLEHDVEWFQRGNMKTPGHKPAGGPWCNLPTVVKKLAGDKIAEAAEVLEWDKPKTAAWLKDEYGASWSKLSPTDQISAMEATGALAKKKLAEDAQDALGEAEEAPPAEEAEMAEMFPEKG